MSVLGPRSGHSSVVAVDPCLLHTTVTQWAHLLIERSPKPLILCQVHAWVPLP